MTQERQQRKAETPTENEGAMLRDIATRTATMAGRTPRSTSPSGRTPTSAEVFAVVQQVLQYTAKLAARAIAQQRARDVRDLARDCARLAERVDACRLNGADAFRAAAERYAHVADNIDDSLRDR